MKKLLLSAAALLLMSANSFAADPAPALPQATLHTSKGDIKVELYSQRSPITVSNFLNYASSGFYDNTIFHRVIRRFVVQGGGLTDDLEEKKNGEPIINESKASGLRNERWTLAMARTADPHSARSQFYINMRLNMDLDARAGKDGYAVFARVIDGQHVVRDIANTPTRSYGGYDDIPVEPVYLKSVSLHNTQLSGKALDRTQHKPQ